jgi:hypothetical protein
MTEVDKTFNYFFHSKRYVINLTKNCLGDILGDFSQTHLVALVVATL